MRSTENKLETSIALPIFHEDEDYHPHRYFKKISQAEKETLIRTYNKSLVSLSHDIENHPIIYYRKVGKNVLASGTNLLWIFFQLGTTEEGAPTFIHVFFPHAYVPPMLGKIIGYPAAILGALTYILNFNPFVEAELETVRSVNIPLKKRVCDALYFARQNPCSTAKQLAHHSALLLFNISAIMPEVLEIPGIKEFLPVWRWTTTGLILYFGIEFMSKYANRTYFYELENYWSKYQDPWVIPYFFTRGQYATLLQLFIKSVLSTACIRGFPTHFYIAIAANEFFGFFPPAPFMAVLTAAVNFIFLYPSTAREYLADVYAVEKQLLQCDKNQIAAALRIKPEFVAKNPLEFLKLQQKDYQDDIIKKYGRMYIKNDFTVMALGAYRGFVGAFFGYYSIAPNLLLLIDAPLPITIISTSVFALAFMDLFRRSQIPRINAKLTRHDKFPETLEKNPTDDANLMLKIFASLLVGCTGVSTAMSTMGTLQRIPGGESSWLRTLVALIAVDNMIVTIAYNFSHTLKTLGSVFTCCRAKPSKTPGTLFHIDQSRPAVHHKELKQVVFK